jgi:hypothetical protein
LVCSVAAESRSKETFRTSPSLHPSGSREREIELELALIPQQKDRQFFFDLIYDSFHFQHLTADDISRMAHTHAPGHVAEGRI